MSLKLNEHGYNQVGNYGTLSLLKRRPGEPPVPSKDSNLGDVVTSFGIDERTLTFGSKPSCHVRLYYPDVDILHCQLVFENGKAFLYVFGQGGVYVDGCWVYPPSQTTTGYVPMADRQQVIIPLSDNTEFEIHHKRFRYTYPPKEARKVMLLDSPAPQDKRPPRLSMIEMAVVFNQGPFASPAKNLQVLKTPLKIGALGSRNSSNNTTPTRRRAVSPLKYSSKHKSSSDDEEEEDCESNHEGPEVEEEIVLAHSNNPRVITRESDMIILEREDLEPKPAELQVPVPLHPRAPAAAAQPPRTPRRQSLGGTALHRAVLIRSAQRAVWRAQLEEEEREEEMEVLGTVVDPVEVEEDGDEDENEEEEQEDQDVEMRDLSSEDCEGLTDEDDDEVLAQKETDKSLWRKSLERIIPWGFGSSADGEDKEEDIQNENDDAQEDMDADEDEAPTPLPVRPAQTPIRRALGSFMTPQAGTAQAKRSVFPQTGDRRRTSMAPPGLPAPAPAEAPAPTAGLGRFSLGGGEARRVIVQQPWRLKDLILPPGPAASGATSSATPTREPPTTPKKTPAVTEEERLAIQERRRSAVREFKEDTFWKDGAPGMSPTKNNERNSSARPRSVSPVKQTIIASSSATLPTPRRPVFGSPTKGRVLGYAIAEEGGTPEGSRHAPDDDEEDSELDTRSLLDRMRETVEDMKRRRSIISGTPRLNSATVPTATIEQSGLPSTAPVPAGTPTSVALTTPERQTGRAFHLGSVKKLDFTRINTPVARAGSALLEATDFDMYEPDGKSKYGPGGGEDEPFTLLRPVREASPSRKPPSRGTRGTRSAAKEAQEYEEVTEEARSVSLPTVVVEEAADEAMRDAHENDVKEKPKARSRLLRAPKPAAAKAVEDIEEDEEAQEPSRSNGKTRSAAKPRSRSAKSPAPSAELETPAALAPAPRRQRSRTPQQPVEEDHTEPPPKPTARRIRKTTAEPEEPTITPAPTRRGRKAIAEPESDGDGQPGEQEKKTKAPAKRGRKLRVAAVEEEEEEADEAEAPEPTPAAAPVKRGRAKKAAAPTAEQQAPEEDELDSYEARPGSSSKTKSSIPVKAATRGRKKAAVVKHESVEEPAEEVDAAPLATTRGGRTAKANSATKTPAASKTAVPATAPSKIAKPRGKPKAPSTAPAAAIARAQVISGGNDDTAEKENTPGTSGSGASEEVVEDAPVKIRMSKRTGAAAAAVGSGKATKAAITKSATRSTTKSATKASVKVEEHEEETQEEANRGRKTRVTRARTKVT